MSFQRTCPIYGTSSNDHTLVFTNFQDSKSGQFAEDYHCLDTTLRHHPLTGDLVQFRLNVYDRAVHRMPVEDLRQFYTHYRRLAEEAADTKAAAWISLDPGRNEN